MIGYVTLGTNDIAAASAFYDRVLGVLGAKRIMEGDRFVAWGNSPTQASLGVIKPFNGEPATVGNGAMAAIAAATPEQVQQVYDLARSLGAADEGAPGPRGTSGFYAAYFRDLEGNKLAVFCMVAAQ